MDAVEQRKQAVKRAIEVYKIIFEAIQEAGSEGIPSGVLFSMLMEYGCTLDQFHRIIASMVGTKLVSETNHVLVALVPGIAAKP